MNDYMKEQLKKSSKGKVDHYVIGVGEVKKAKSEALKKKKERQTSTKYETPEGQRNNVILRKGKKRPEHGPWPIAD